MAGVAFVGRTAPPVTTGVAAAPGYPAGVLAGDTLVRFVTSDVAAISATVSDAGWSPVGGVFQGGLVFGRVWVKTAAGGESGAPTSDITGGTLGISWIGQYRSAGGGPVTVELSTGADANASSTAVSMTGASLTSIAGDLVATMVSMLATPGTAFVKNLQGWVIAYGTATTTLQTIGRASVNQSTFLYVDAAVTASTTATPVLTADTNGANGTGVAAFLRLRESTNTAPTANAGPDQTIEAYSTVTLDGTGSSDPDMGDTLTGVWTQTGGATVDIAGAGLTRTFTPTATFVGETLTFSLTVTDAQGASSAPDTVTITVRPWPEWVATSTGRDPIRRVFGPPPVIDPPAGDGLVMAADQVANFMGVCATGSNVNASVITDAFNYLGFRHARIGRIDTNGGTQKSNATALGLIGVDVMCIPDDRGTPTPADRMTYALTQWGTAAVRGFEGPNEPQRTYGNAAEWPMTIPTNGPTSSDTLLGVNEARRQAALIWSTRNADTNGAASIPLLMSSMATKSKLGWNAKLGTVDCTHGNIHCYAGGQDLLKGSAVANYINETEASGFVGNPAFVTECGYHDMLDTTGTHKPTSRTAQAIYLPRGMLEMWVLGHEGGQLQGAYLYELVDDPAGGSGTAQYECNFGLFEIISGTLTPKPSAVALARTQTLYDDLGPEVVTNSIVHAATGGGASLRSAVHQRRDGTHLLALWRAESVFNTSTLQDITVSDVTVTVTLPAGRAVTRHRPTPGTVASMGSGGSYSVPVGADLTVLVINP